MSEQLRIESAYPFERLTANLRNLQLRCVYLARDTTIFTALRTLRRQRGEKNLLDSFYFAWALGRFPAPHLVGIGGHNPYRIHILVGGLPQRLVQLVLS